MKHKIQILFLLVVMLAGCNTTPEIVLQVNQGLHVYPNPAVVSIQIRLENNGSNGNLRVYDSTGELFFQASILTGENSYAIDLQNRPVGIYHVVAEMQGQILTSKFMRIE